MMLANGTFAGKTADSYGRAGAAYWTRTSDPLITNEVLYQLS